jgi:hypothetical protein
MHRNLKGKACDNVTGKYDIEVISKKVKYSLTIENNINILRGNSATGKTIKTFYSIEGKSTTKQAKIRRQ